MQALETHLLAGEGRAGREQGGKEVVVVANSQMYAENFYAKLGWTRDGEPHIEVSERGEGRGEGLMRLFGVGWGTAY